MRALLSKSRSDATWHPRGSGGAVITIPAERAFASPSLFEMVIKGLGAAGLAAHARVIVEKPFGRDLASARERWGCHHDSGRASFRISNAQRGVERRSLHLNWFRSVTYLLISDSKIGGGC